MNNRLFLFAVAAAFTLALATTYFAEEPAKTAQGKGPFVEADKDGEGKLTDGAFAAFASARMRADAAKAKFKELDKNGDGTLSREEFLATMPKHRK